MLFRCYAKFFLLLATFTFLLIGCGQRVEKPTQSTPQVGRLTYQVVETSSLADLPGALQKWYEENFRVDGLHSYTLDGVRYILLSVGEKRTGGYAIEDLTMNGSNEEIEVTARLRSPQSGESVIQALTYPHMLVRITEDGRKLRLGEISGPKNATEDTVKNDSGTYVGQIDNNSIEITISGVPAEKSAKAFRLGDQLRDNFDRLGLETGDQVLFSYFENENGQPVLTSITEVKN